MIAAPIPQHFSHAARRIALAAVPIVLILALRDAAVGAVVMPRIIAGQPVHAPRIVVAAAPVDAGAPT